MSSISHVIVDEAHERSEDGDFLLFVLRELLPHAPQLRARR
jgi:ATP-dependent RNA helicase DHX36